MNPAVSLIIPTYNRAFFLKEALESVFAQTRRPDETIVIDDGSTDETQEVIHQFDRVIYIQQPNKGVSSARNLGIRYSTGEWICFLDSDDLWMKNKLACQMERIKKNSQFLANYTNEIWIRNGKRVNPCKRHEKYSGWIFDKCLPLCTISPSSIILHRTVLEKTGVFDEALPVCEDYDLWLRISLHFPIDFINQPLIIKRGGHQDQLSKKFFGMDRFRVQALEKILQDPQLHPDERKIVLKELKTKSLVYAQGCLRRNRLTEYNEYQTKIKNLCYENC